MTLQNENPASIVELESTEIDGSSENAEDRLLRRMIEKFRKRFDSPFFRWFGWFLKAGIAVVILLQLSHSIQMDRIKEAFLQANSTYVLIAFLLMPINVILQAIRWKTLASTEAPGASYWRIMSSLMAGWTFGLLTPGRVGEIVRIFLLKAPSRLRLAGLHVLDKMYFFGAVSLTGPLMLFLLPGFREAVPPSLRTSGLIFVSILPLLFFWLALDPKPLKALFIASQFAFGKKVRLFEALRVYEGLKFRHCAISLGVTALQIFFILVQFSILTNAFEPVRWNIAFHTYAATLFVKAALPISLGNLGVGEFAAVSFYSLYGVSDATAFSASLLLFLFNVLLPSLVGLVYLTTIKIPVFSEQAILSRVSSKDKAA